MEQIFIIDDSIFNVHILSQILGNEYKILSASDGRSALKQLHENQPSLILLDIIMPRMDGFEVLARLKTDEHTQDIPVIIITGLIGNQIEEKCLGLGAVDYIVKPFSAGIVRARVRTHVELFRYRRNAEQLALCDGLTGIANRRGYETHARKEWKHACESRLPISAFLADIDFFKEYNDQYGHLMGDDAVRVVARVLAQSMHHIGDFVARFGGEEFIAILPNVSGEEGLAIAQKMGEMMEAIGLPHASSGVSSVLTVSIGGASIIPKPGDRLDHFIRIVDQMLYRAKESGRNHVEWKNL